eukprot:21522-Heterococcus_DN1.PRE.2
MAHASAAATRAIGTALAICYWGVPLSCRYCIRAYENTAAAEVAAGETSAQQLDKWFSEGEAAFQERFAQIFSATTAAAAGNCASTDSAAATAGDAAAVAVPVVTPYVITERDHIAAKASIGNLLGSMRCFSGKTIIKVAGSDAISSGSGSSDAHAESFATSVSFAAAGDVVPTRVMPSVLRLLEALMIRPRSAEAATK